MSVITLDYIRHGQPAGGSKYRGHGIDDPLSETGWAQMRDTTASLDGWTQVISSPMSRCRAFAEWIAEQRELPLQIVDDLREIGFGSWEGATREELLRERPEEYHAFYRDPVNRRPPGAESLHDFGLRVAAAFDSLLQQYAGRHLLVVAHAGVVRATLGHVLQTPAANWYRAAVNNAAVSRFRHDRHGNKLIVHNWRPGLHDA
jgi:alpha-ribazole phosphatase